MLLTEWLSRVDIKIIISFSLQPRVFVRLTSLQRKLKNMLQ